MPDPELYIGMLSGTSRDGVDVGLVSFKQERPRLQTMQCTPYPPRLAALLKNMIESGRRPPADELSRADGLLADFFAQTVNDFLGHNGINRCSVNALGSHGQTVWHAPEDPSPVTIQLGDPQKIANLTGITTVGDFRSQDLAAGGQGAPLAPLLHRALFQPVSGNRIILNLGGIANVSVLASDGEVTGFDTGPANCLLDAWIQDRLGERYDKDGEWSAGGEVDSQLLRELLRDPYFDKLPPKSTGVEYFNRDWLSRRARTSSISARDVQATLAQFTACSIALALPDVANTEILVCGGGANNRDLLNRLQLLVPDCPLQSTATHGIDPDAVEAVLFAWLARERLANRLQDTSSITGAREPVLLGSIYQSTLN
jgi:anhydro-N-acetylmuramic acid kinase